jgi:hypothetical protein
MPGNFFGVCTMRHPVFYFPGEECWPISDSGRAR